MRIFKLLAVLSLIHSICWAQSSISENKAIIMLKQFYIAHEKIESSIKTIRPQVYLWKLDSLQKKYCTLKLRNTIKKYQENGIDILTNDQGIDSESLKTMKIVEDSEDKNVYIVSYDFLEENYPKKPFTRHVILHVGLVTENNSYKINSIR